VCAFGKPLQPLRVSWLVRATGIAAASDGRIGCIRLGEQPGVEAVRMYFTAGNLWWEESERDPKPLLRPGSFRDGRWYHVVCRFDWQVRSCELSIEPLLDEGGGHCGEAAAEIVRHPWLAFHSSGCMHIQFLAVGSIVWASSPLSQSTSHVAEIVFQGDADVP